jgi:hypothetical protein
VFPSLATWTPARRRNYHGGVDPLQFNSEESPSAPAVYSVVLLSVYKVEGKNLKYYRHGTEIHSGDYEIWIITV